MKGANKAFLDQKDRWLLNNLLVYQVMTPPTGSPNNVYSFDLWKIGTIKDGGGATRTMFELHQISERLIKDKADKSTNHIRAYFLPWTTGQTKSMQLGNDADFFFTPTLTGCTFAAASGANPTVAHSNYVTGRRHGRSGYDRRRTEYALWCDPDPQGGKDAIQDRRRCLRLPRNGRRVPDHRGLELLLSTLQANAGGQTRWRLAARHGAPGPGGPCDLAHVL